MTSVRLRIDRIAVEILEEQRAGEVQETLKTALALLSSRLAGAPLSGFRAAPLRALELLDLGVLSPDQLSGPGAAARLSEELYNRIVRAGT